MVSWTTIQSLLIFFGPILLPRALTYYRSIRDRPTSRIRPLPSQQSYALSILFFSGLAFLISTVPLFQPPNVFQQTNSRLQTPAGVIMTRLKALRPLTESDERLRYLFDIGGLDARLIYARFGPSVLLYCQWAEPGDADAGRAYLFHALPTLLAPHLLHLVVLGLATSGLWGAGTGKEWRTLATAAGLTVAAAELWLISTYDDHANMRSTRLGEVDFAYWKLRVWRGLVFAAMDGALGWVIWLQATGRAFSAPVPAVTRLTAQNRGLEELLARLKGVGVLRNGVVRDDTLRARLEDYWIKEGEVMKDVYEEPDVMQAQRNALRRVDGVRVRRDADTYLENVFKGVSVAGVSIGHS